MSPSLPPKFFRALRHSSCRSALSSAVSPFGPIAPGSRQASQSTRRRHHFLRLRSRRPQSPTRSHATSKPALRLEHDDIWLQETNGKRRRLLEGQKFNRGNQPSATSSIPSAGLPTLTSPAELLATTVGRRFRQGEDSFMPFSSTTAATKFASPRRQCHSRCRRSLLSSRRCHHNFLSEAVKPSHPLS